MPKILSQAGNSLADTYDVEGSVAGIDTLETRELPIVHEMGATVFSERCSAAIRRMNTGAIAQNLNFDVVLTDLPAGLWRILGVFVLANQQARVLNALVAVGDGTREMPIFVWDTNDDVETAIRYVDDGAAAANLTAMRQSRPTGMPSLGIDAGQPQRIGQIAFRGASSGFGAGTVSITAYVHIAFSALGGVPGNTGSRGVPIPGW